MNFPVLKKSLNQFIKKNSLMYYFETITKSLLQFSWGVHLLLIMNVFITMLKLLVKGTVSRDFRPSVFFVKLYPWVP
jgi:hypothetical protein